VPVYWNASIFFQSCASELGSLAFIASLRFSRWTSSSRVSTMDAVWRSSSTNSSSVSTENIECPQGPYSTVPPLSPCASFMQKICTRDATRAISSREKVSREAGFSGTSLIEQLPLTHLCELLQRTACAARPNRIARGTHDVDSVAVRFCGR